MFKGIYSHYLRTKRTASRIVVLLCPILYALILSLYFKSHPNIQQHSVFAYYYLFGIISSFSFSFFVPLVYKPDANANHFANEIRFAIKRSKNLVYKFLLITLMYFFMLMLSTLLFYSFMKTFAIWYTTPKDVFIFACIVFFTSIQYIPIFQFIYLRFNSSTSIMVGSFLCLLSLLLGSTGLGYIIWNIIPFTYGIRLMDGYYKHLLSIGDITFYLTISTLFTLALLLMNCVWYNKVNLTTNMEDEE